MASATDRIATHNEGTYAPCERSRYAVQNAGYAWMADGRFQPDLRWSKVCAHGPDSSCSFDLAHLNGGHVSIEGEHMRRLIVMGTAIGLLLLMAIPAFAAKPDVVVDEDFLNEFTIPAGELCDFPVDLVESGHERITEFLSGDGDLVKAHVQVRGTGMWTGPGGTATEHFAWSGIFDAEAMTFTQNGNVWNLHMGAGGTILHDKGQIVFDENTGDAIRIKGPHDVWDDGLGALCDAIG